LNNELEVDEGRGKEPLLINLTLNRFTSLSVRVLASTTRARRFMRLMPANARRRLTICAPSAAAGAVAATC
jgi:hypothetical protein